jgi:hypothetical protein
VGAESRTREEGRRARVCVCLSSHLPRSCWREHRGGGGGDCFVQLCFPPPPASSFLLLLDSSPPTHVHGEPAPPAGTSSLLSRVATSCSLPDPGLRRCRVPWPLALRPRLDTRSPDWRGGPLVQTDSETARTDALLHGDSGQADIQGQGEGDGEKEASEILNPGKVQGLCRCPQGKRGGAACPSAETARPERRRVARSSHRLAEPLSILQHLRTGGWSRRSEQKGLGSGRSSLLSRLPRFSKPCVHGAAGSGCATLTPAAEPLPGQAARSRLVLARASVETGESALEPRSELCEGTNIWPPASGISSGRRLGWWRPASPVSALHGNFFFSGWIKVAWIFSFFAKEIPLEPDLGFLCWGCCRALGRKAALSM